MARIYSGKKGESGSKKPPSKVKPKWVKQTPEEVEKLVVELSKNKYSSAVIGTILRDSHGIPDVKIITGKTVSKIMRENSLYPDYPEDLMNMFRQAIRVSEHLNLNKGDKHSKRGLKNLEAKIRRLIKYYAVTNKVPKGFQYDYQKVKLLVQK